MSKVVATLANYEIKDAIIAWVKTKRNHDIDIGLS